MSLSDFLSRLAATKGITKARRKKQKTKSRTRRKMAAASRKANR